MPRVAFTLLGGKNWTGGYNYLLNLLGILRAEFSDRLSPVLFVAADGDPDAIAAFRKISNLEILTTPLLNAGRRKISLLKSLVLGVDDAMERLLIEAEIDLVFEAAQFFGWRLRIPAIAWIPDFQHLTLPAMFSLPSRLKREIGFRAQVWGGREIMLSSEDARRICLARYPVADERAHTIHFAVPAGPELSFEQARRIADEYELPDAYFYLPNQMWRHKNHSLVVDALALLRQAGRPVFVAVSGKQQDPRNPDVFSRLQKQVARLGVGADIKFLGMIPYPHLQALMRASSALINPSLSEGWSTTVEEARAMGVPMLLSDLDVHREQMGEQAIYFDRHSAQSLADELDRFVPPDQQQRLKMIGAARQDARVRVTQFGEAFARLMEDRVQRSPAR